MFLVKFMNEKREKYSDKFMKNKFISKKGFYMILLNSIAFLSAMLVMQYKNILISFCFTYGLISLYLFICLFFIMFIFFILVKGIVDGFNHFLKNNLRFKLFVKFFKRIIVCFRIFNILY
jgi:hypothetical protein